MLGESSIQHGDNNAGYIEPCLYRGAERKPGWFECASPFVHIQRDGLIPAIICTENGERKCPHRNRKAERGSVITLGVQNGPGTELSAIFNEMGISACQSCRNMALQMNEWGPQGCLERMDLIVSQIFQRAEQFGWLAKMATTLVPGLVRGKIEEYVHEAIRRAEKKR